MCQNSQTSQTRILVLLHKKFPRGQKLDSLKRSWPFYMAFLPAVFLPSDSIFPVGYFSCPSLIMAVACSSIAASCLWCLILANEAFYNLAQWCSFDSLLDINANTLIFSLKKRSPNFHIATLFSQL